jgi:hypothetical protein
VRRAASVLAAAAALALPACGSGGDETGLTGPQRRGLLTRVELIREAGTAHDRELAQRRLRGFRREVERLLQAGALDVGTARALVLTAARAEARAAIEIQPPPAPQPTPEPRDKQKKEKHDKEHGKKGDKKHRKEKH